MISPTYSDPFLKQLSENNSKEAAEYFMLISESKYKDDLAVCLETPQEILIRIGVKACENPNFPQSELEKFLNDEETLDNSFWDIFSSPNLTEKNISQLMRCSNPSVRGLALAHEHGNPKELLKFLKEEFEAGFQAPVVVAEICRNRKLTDEVLQFLLSVYEIEPSHHSVGAELWSNPFLTPEQRAALVLYSVDVPESKSVYWESHRFYASTLAFLSYFKCSDYDDRTKVESLKSIPDNYVKSFAQLGHPLGLLLPEQQNTQPVIHAEALKEMILEYNLLHRLFWPELCEREDFEIYRRNAVQTDDLFISHPILGREFENCMSEDATHLGGVFIFSDNYTWLSGHEKLSLNMAVSEFYSTGCDLVEHIENFGNSGFKDFGVKLAALTFDDIDPELADKYGYKLKEKAASDVIEAMIPVAYPHSFDVSAEINSDFPEKLSWRNLPETNKRGIFELLKIGSTLPESKATSDSIHFLGCMALHGDTSDSLLKELSSLGIPIVDEVLASRDMG